MEPERCDECGFDGTLLTTAEATTSLRSMGRRWREAFKGLQDEVLRRRPDAKTWSPLEYAAHTRDVLALVGWGMAQVLEGGRPSFPDIAADEDAPDHGYNDLDPEQVLSELAANAERIAARAKRALPEHWSRTGTAGGREVDAGWLLRHAAHDASHHLKDVERILAPVRPPDPDDDSA